jgi:predicted nucleic acid-binding protein
VIVIDASAMIDLLAGHEPAPRIAALLDDDVFAPERLIPEVIQYFRRHGAGGSAARADTAVSDFADSPIEYVSTWPHIDRIWELRHALSASDACYVAVAESLGCPLLTTDRRLAGANGVRAPILAV